MTSQDQGTSPPMVASLQQERPRFCRAITSPLPGLSAFGAQAAGEPRVTLHPLHSEPAGPSPSTIDTHDEDISPRVSRPRPQPLQLQTDQQQLLPSLQDSALRSFSSSILSSFLPSTPGTILSVPTSPTSPTQPRTSITETLLNGRRWSRAQTLNWMPGFTRGHYPDGSEALPSPVTATESFTRSQKCVQRHSSVGGEGHQQSDGCANLGLDTVSVARNPCHNESEESSLNHLKDSEARRRGIAESGRSVSSLSSKHSSTGLTERLSGFAQSMRTRPSLNGDNPTPPSSADFSDASTAEWRPTLQKHRAVSDGASAMKNRTHMTCVETELASDFTSWDDFMESYGQGDFPNQSQHYPRSHLGSDFPPIPDYAKDNWSMDPPPFLSAPLPPSEERRLRALYSFQILETGSDMNFQRVAQLVSTVLGTSGCMICLVDYQNIAIKAHHRAENMECKREVSLSAHAILRPPNDPLVVLDVSRDWRFKNLPAVTGGPKVRFYAGASLATSDGHNIGSLCVIDPKPRVEFTEKEKMLLVDFAAVVMREMELWNDQVQLCTRTRMMRDISRWVRGCLDMDRNYSTSSSARIINSSSRNNSRSDTGINGSTTSVSTDASSFSANLPPDGSVLPKFTATPPAVISESLPPNSGKAAYTSTRATAALPTPTGSPTLLSSALGSKQNGLSPVKGVSGDRLEDEAFPSACGMIQATTNVDVVYLVQATPNKSLIPINDSDVVWNYLGAGSRATGSIGTVGDLDLLKDASRWTLNCLASSQKSTVPSTFPVVDESTKQSRQDKSWICSDEGCRPHRLGEPHPDAVGPQWERDMPIISEMLSYVRQERTLPIPAPGKCPLFTVSQHFDEDDPSSRSTHDSTFRGAKRDNLLCHTFQGTLQDLTNGKTSPYRSCVIMPIRGASSANYSAVLSEEPWAYFVVFSSSRTKQFTFHERIYLKNFGSCLITEVLKRRVEAADKVKGIFIKSISHELRTPLHIILGILELLNNNTEHTLSEHQLSMIASAEASGSSLIDIINNIIDLADLDPDNTADSRNCQRGQGSLPELYTHVAEVDIRELCEEVAGAMVKSCIDKNVVILPSWTKPSLISLSSSISTSAPKPTSSTSTSMRITVQGQSDPGNTTSLDESVSGDTSSADSQSGFFGSGLFSDHGVALELLVAMDEPEKDPDHDTTWNFMLNLPVIKRILTQLLENALKFTTTGFVEISAVSPPLSTFPLKPPTPEARPILFTVRDTGRGISPDFIQAHLFQSFSQEDPLQVGTGLGLALVKLLVESLGGWLEIWSEGINGKGCVVRVLVWAAAAKTMTKSLKDKHGPWQEKSCRFYTGEPTVSTDRLWKIMGERIMTQDLNMNVQRGNEQDISPEDMLKNLRDQSSCDLLILNDDLTRLKAYLLHWTDLHTAAKLSGSGLGSSQTPTPVPVLMLTSISTAKNARNLVEAYRKAWHDMGRPDRLATVVLMPKPIGPLKLERCLRACFASDEDPRAAHNPSEPMDDMETIQPSPIPLLRSVTVPHITTMALGVHDTRLLSAGAMIKSSFKFPTSPTGMTALGGNLDPPHSPGGLILPPRGTGAGAGGPSLMSSLSEDSALTPATKSDCTSSIRPTKPQRSIRNFMSHRNGYSKGNSNSKKQAAAATSSDEFASETASTTSTHVLGLPLVSGNGESDNVADQLGKLNPVPRVLIVEDNITNRMILRTFLKKRGVAVVEAENGKLGVERFQEEVWRREGRSGFEFVLMDLQMPVMDGNLATKRIREFEQSMVKQHGLSTPETSSRNELDDLLTSRAAAARDASEWDRKGYRPTTIFALTGLAGEEDKRLAFECGVDGYLTKPVSLKTLGALLSSCHPSHVNGSN